MQKLRNILPQKLEQARRTNQLQRKQNHRTGLLTPIDLDSVIPVKSLPREFSH